MSEHRSPKKRAPYVLFVDDRQDDVELAKLTLAREFPEAEVRHVANAISFGEIFERGGFDVVITERNLSWTSGVSILEAAKERWPYLPVIMFASEGDECMAVEAMKAGLDDYLRKSTRSFVLLPTVVRAALERAENRRQMALLETRLQTLLDHTNVGVFRSTLDGRLLEVNAAFLKLFGRAPAAKNLPSLGRTNLDLRELLGGRGDEDLNLFDQSGRYNHEMPLRRPDGTTIWLSMSEMILLDAEGDLVIDGLVQDISRFRQALPLQEEKPVERPADPAADLAAMVSHELREPLRAIESHLKLVENEVASGLSAKGRESMEFAIDGSQRLQALIQHLMTLARLSSEAPTFELVSSRDTVDEALGNLEGLLSQSGVEVAIDPLPTVRADHDQLVVLFQNLIENGVKFHSEKKPRVRVSAKQHSEEWVFSIEDNGVGIDPVYEKLIFSPFKRLQTEIAGSGLGLTLCQRIVEHHSGRIWVESEPGRGSTFFFTLPLSRRRTDVGPQARVRPLAH